MNRRANFLNWVADRLVNVYGEPPNIDFVNALRREAGLVDEPSTAELTLQDIAAAFPAEGEPAGLSRKQREALQHARRLALAITMKYE